MGITQADVAEAAEKISLAGENPTIEKVRLTLGMGSNTTISKYLNDWRNKQEVLQEHSSTVAPPDPVNAAVQQVWVEMQARTHAEIKTIQDQAQQEITFASQQLQCAVVARDLLVQQISELERQNNQLQADKELLSIDLRSHLEDKKLLQEKVHALQNQYEILEKHTTAQIEELKHEITLLDCRHLKTISDLQLTYDKAIQEFGNMHENERQRQVVMIDDLKLQEKKHEKLIKDLRNHIQDLNIKISEKQLLLTVYLKENEKILKENAKKDEIINALKKLNNFEIQLDSLKLYLDDQFVNLLREQSKLALNQDIKLQQTLSELSQFCSVKTE